jgi:hypothetical protein
MNKAEKERKGVIERVDVSKRGSSKNFEDKELILLLYKCTYDLYD